MAVGAQRCFNSMTRELGNLSHSSRKRCQTQRDATAPSTGKFWQSTWPSNTSVIFWRDVTFHVLTDHKPLTYALHTCSDRHSPRQARHLDYISQFTSTIRHIHGQDNVVADALSRVEMNALCFGEPPVVDFVSMAKAQKLDPQIRALQSSPNTSLKIEAVPIACSPTDTVLCDTSTGTQRPLIPLDWRRVIFDSMHGLSHPGIRATQKLITARFVWPGVNVDVRRWCIQCQRSKIHRHTIAPLQSLPLPQARFDISIS